MLIVAILLFSSLGFLSQTRPQSQVSTIHPDDADGGGPPVTDQDKDGIPDLHEELFSPVRNLTFEGGIFTVLGLDPTNGSDNISDHDNDGLSALQEYCWPYDLVRCYAERQTLTGKPAEFTVSGLREFLDPRESDTDGDGLPDGYEYHMCVNEGLGHLNETYAWECDLFDPLEASDGISDIDRCPDFSLGCGDGFDVDRDGVIATHERFTNAEEYAYGAPINWTTEIHGLRCSGMIEDLTDSCTDLEFRATGEAGWLGTDPLRNDSDDHYWAGTRSMPQTQRGDGINDGWEVYFSLDPLNSSDAIVDSDSDGWDLDRNGVVSQDSSRATVSFGEALSNLEEYRAFFDDGTTVRSGLKMISFDDLNDSVSSLDQGTSPAIIHHHVVSIEPVPSQSKVVIGTKLGISVIDLVNMTTVSVELPAGVEMSDLILWQSEGNYFAVMATSRGVETMSFDESLNPEKNTLETLPFGLVKRLFPLATGDQSLSLLCGGETGAAFRVLVETDGEVSGGESVGQLTDLLNDTNATILDAAHVTIPGRPQTLYVATSAGLIAWNTSDLGTGDNPFWIIDVDNAEDYLRPADAFDISKSAIINTLVIDGPRNEAGELTSEQALWIGSAGGLHQFDLIEGLADTTSAFDMSRMENPSVARTGGYDIRVIIPLRDSIVIGSADGTWMLEGDYTGVLGLDEMHNTIPGIISELALVDVAGNTTMLGAVQPGRYAGLTTIDPLSADSDRDGMPDGWEHVHGLDPTDPWDRDLDSDADGVNTNPDIDVWNDLNWTNLDEFRYLRITDQGLNGTDPRLSDTDGDGLSDGSEHWGWFEAETNFTCYYLNEDHVCDDAIGESARQVYLNGWLNSGAGGGSDQPLDPTNNDTDQDGMPDGWEIHYRRWIGSEFTGGNDWTLDPLNPNDANEDADGDGLTNLCEYRWQLILATAQNYGLSTHGESMEAAMNWTAVDPNIVDSDGDSLPDGWEARYTCSWPSEHAGINPLNGSDAFSNPDGDGYDVNHDGIFGPNESFNNWMEYHIMDRIIYGNISDDDSMHPNGFETLLWDPSWQATASTSFGSFQSQNVIDWHESLVDDSRMVSGDLGASNPLSVDTDDDGMPDGWEVWFARWDSFDSTWTLNPVDDSDIDGDPDGDGLTNWEEYGSIANSLNEIDQNVSSPQFYLLKGIADIFQQPWTGAGSNLSFGNFLSPAQENLTGVTLDPNNPDCDGDGLLDGIELMFTAWNDTDGIWTLNPFVAGDGQHDGDGDALTDLQELNLTYENPKNGGLAPPDAPTMREEAEEIDKSESVNRIYRILQSKEGRSYIALQQYKTWQQSNYTVAEPLLQTLLGISDPNAEDTDRDGMIDGYEYWFTEWDLDANMWTMNPLTDADVTNPQVNDADNDSWDCNNDGVIDADEKYTNLREYEARISGKELERNNFPPGIGVIDFGQDTINAFISENGDSTTAAKARLYTLFASKDITSSERLIRINTAYWDNFNLSLSGISDPTHSDSDNDGILDGWEYCYARYQTVQPVTEYRWSTNPVNPLDVDYDPDEDGWFDRTEDDNVAVQGNWQSRVFSPGQPADQYSNGRSSLFFTNLMEWLNGTNPILKDSDGDSTVMIRSTNSTSMTGYDVDENMSDGREVYKYGTNPMDNDTDGDMLPDWYEYGKGWNESNDNWSSYREIRVVWEEIGADNWKPLTFATDLQGSLLITRPMLEWVWTTMDPTDPFDSVQDPDNDGGWDCSGAACSYIPYNNFQEFFGITNASLSSAGLVRQTPIMDCDGNQVREWWQFREVQLGYCDRNWIDSNYFRMRKVNASDELYAHVVEDNDPDYQMSQPADDTHLVWGNWTDSWNRSFGDKDHLPILSFGEFVWGWYHLDMDGDQIADGTDPFNYDTDGDWLNDFFEIDDDLLDGVRGNGGSPIRYDDRATTTP